jgi:hypothetical protein
VASSGGTAIRGFAGVCGVWSTPLWADEEYLMIVFATSVKNKVPYLPLTANPLAEAN